MNIYNIIIIYEQRRISHSQISRLYQEVGTLMEPKPKLLAYRNMVPDAMFM